MATFNRGNYLTIAEYRAIPTALNTQNLVPGGTQTDQDNELSGIITRASRQLDSWARQPLYATQTVNQRESTRIDDKANIVLHGRQDRVASVDALAWGYNITNLTTINPPISAWIEEDRAKVPLTSSGLTWVGGLNLISAPAPGSQIYVQWSYTAGFACTILASQATLGASSVTVSDPTGIIAGTWMTLVNGADTTDVQVAATYTAGQATVPLTAALAETWPAGSGFTAVPADLREGCALATSHYIKMRKGSGVVMSKTPTLSSTRDELGPEMDQAKEIALRYERRTP